MLCVTYEQFPLYDDATKGVFALESTFRKTAIHNVKTQLAVRRIELSSLAQRTIAPILPRQKRSQRAIARPGSGLRFAVWNMS